MNLEQAKKASDILQKINEYKESIRYLTFSETHNIQFSKLHNMGNFFILDKEVVDEIVIHSIFTFKERILTLNKELENL
jgi:uncharacterized protein YlzI (FlbEa/FlbD family)